MPAPRREVITALLALNSDDAPYSFSATANGVVGVWNYADAKWAGLLAAGSVDSSFEMRVELHDDGTFSTTDRTTSKSAHAGFDGGSFSFSSFSGKVSERSYDSSAAPIASDHGQVGHTFGWRFNSAEMKTPVVATLTQHGWIERKTGFWAKLFGG